MKAQQAAAQGRRTTAPVSLDVITKHAMNTRTVMKVLGGIVIILLLVLVIGIGVLHESHTFRATVSGRITDLGGNPIADAKVEYLYPNSDDVKYNRDAMTDSEGRYYMQLPQVTVALDLSPCYSRSVIVRADGYQSYTTYKKLAKGYNRTCDYSLKQASSEDLKEQLETN